MVNIIHHHYVDAPNFWLSDHDWRKYALLPLSYLWHAGLVLKQAQQQANKVPKANIPVICVGNIMVGGSGKTPLTQALARFLIANGKTPHILTRGYGRHRKGTFYVDLQRHEVKDIGDEAAMHAQICPTLLFDISRADAIEQASENAADIVICDDGFQDLSYHKDLSLLAIDRHRGFGNGCLLPAGALREPLANALKRADMIALCGHGENHASIDKIDNSLKKHDIDSQSTYDIDADKNIIGFCALGNPHGFKDYLQQEFHHRLLEFHIFRDHYFYKPQDIEDLLERSNKENALILTTYKDYVKIPKQYQEYINVVHQQYILPMPLRERALQML